MARTEARGLGLRTPTRQAEEEGSKVERARHPCKRRHDALQKSEGDRGVEMGGNDSKRKDPVMCNRRELLRIWCWGFQVWWGGGCGVGSG